jgi:hypothetical protein
MTGRLARAAPLCFQQFQEMSKRRGPPGVEIAVVAIGIAVAGASGVMAYRVVGLYGDGPFAHGYHRERDPATGGSMLIQEFLTARGKVRRVINSANKVTELRIDADADGVEDSRLTLDGGTLTKAGFSLAGDGVIDAWAFRDANNQLVRIEVSTKRNGRVDRWEHYVNGKMVRVDQDTNGNGKFDRWMIYEDGILLDTFIDLDEDGQPDGPPR